MEQDTFDLIERLLVQAACVMEDVTPELLTTAENTVFARIDAAHTAAKKISALAAAAAAMVANPTPSTDP